MTNNYTLKGEALAASQMMTLETEQFLNDNYLFRRNVLSGKVEFATLPAEEPQYRVLTQEALNSIVIRARRENICEKGNPKTEKHKVNLLNSAERYYVANEVVTKLENINTDLWLLAWQIRTMSWQDLWYGLDPEGWATVMSGKAIVESLIYEWNYL